MYNVLFAVVGLVASLATAIPASADDGGDAYTEQYHGTSIFIQTPECTTTTHDPTPVPTMCWPQPAQSTFVIEAPRYAWGVRYAASYIDARVAGITVHSDLGVHCSDYPGAICIRLVKRYKVDMAYNGFYDIVGQTIVLNYNYRGDKLIDRRRVAGHELLHAFGMEHWQGYGLLGKGLPPSNWKPYMAYTPNDAEINALRAWYDAGLTPEPTTVAPVPAGSEHQSPRVR